MKIIAKVSEVIDGWKPSDIAYIKMIQIDVDNDFDQDVCVEMLLLSQPRKLHDGWPDSTKGFTEIRLRFVKVVNFKLEHPGRGALQITGFDIIDVSEDGLEGISYKIEDYEKGVIDFSCKEIIIIE